MEAATPVRSVETKLTRVHGTRWHRSGGAPDSGLTLVRRLVVELGIALAGLPKPDAPEEEPCGVSVPDAGWR